MPLLLPLVSASFLLSLMKTWKKRKLCSGLGQDGWTNKEEKNEEKKEKMKGRGGGGLGHVFCCFGGGGLPPHIGRRREGEAGGWEAGAYYL